VWKEETCGDSVLRVRVRPAMSPSWRCAGDHEKYLVE
jgi:hypothetical protein